MFPAKMSLAERAVAHDALRRVLAVFECAADFFWCSAAERKGDGDGGVGGQGGEGEGGGCEVGAGVLEAEGWGGEGEAEGD